MDGYKIIDFGGITIGESGYAGSIDGIYNAVKTANKPIVYAGINGIKPFYAPMITELEGQYIGAFAFTGDSWFMIAFNDDDTVSIDPIE